MSKTILTKRDVVRLAIFIKTHATIQSIAEFVEKYDLCGVKVKSCDRKYLHLVVNKVTDDKDVEKMLKKYIDKLCAENEFPITIPEGYGKLKLSAFDILITGKNWYIEIFDNKR